MPIFSIVIPAYNLEAYIADTLASIDAQTCSDYEVIIVDDGSTDNTAAVCQKWCASHARFQFYHKDNGGVSSARNYAIDKVTGKYIWFIDGDDFIHPESLSCLLKIFGSHENMDYISFYYANVSTRYTETEFSRLDCSVVNYYTSENQQSFLSMLTQTPYAACCICIRRTAIGELRFKQICTSEDAFFALQLTYQSKGIAVWNASPYYYYQRPGSFVNSSYTLHKLQDYVKFIEYVGTMKGQKNGWGDGYLAFQQYRSCLPYLYRRIRHLSTFSERKQAWQEFRRMLRAHLSLFSEQSVWYAKVAYYGRLRFLVWFFFGLRYDLRDWMLKHEQLAAFWKTLRQ